MKRRPTVALLALIFLLAGCGGGSHHRSTSTSSTTPAGTTAVPSSSPQATGQFCSGLTDRCYSTAGLPQNGGQYRLTPHYVTSGRGCRIVDVSDWQGTVNWGAAAPFICGGITKMGEGTSYAAGGTHFLSNWAELKAHHLWHSGYWYIHGSSGCATQADLIIARLRAVGYASDPLAGNFDLDAETPGANAGSLWLCIDARVFAAFHRHVDVYTSPGTNPGGSHGSLALWQAEYGPALHPIWNPVVAWQCTDGIFGCKTFVPGIGFDDVSLNFGMTSEHPAPPPPPPTPKCLAAKWPHTTLCRRVRFGYHHLAVDRAKVHALIVKHGCQARRRPSYCNGWRHAQNVDDRKLAAFRRRYG